MHHQQARDQIGRDPPRRKGFRLPRHPRRPLDQNPAPRPTRTLIHGIRPPG
jgi:hypothetical protein